MMNPRERLYSVLSLVHAFCEQNFDGSYKQVARKSALEYCVKRHNAMWGDKAPEDLYQVVGN